MIEAEHSAGCTATDEPPRRQSIRQIAAQALRQTKRLGGDDMFMTWQAGNVIGKALAAVAVSRRVSGDCDFDMAILIEYLLDVPQAAKTPDQRARQALFVELCKQLENIVIWAHESKVFAIPEDEREVMRSAAKSASARAKRWKAYRASLQPPA